MVSTSRIDLAANHRNPNTVPPFVDCLATTALLEDWAAIWTRLCLVLLSEML